MISRVFFWSCLILGGVLFGVSPGFDKGPFGSGFEATSILPGATVAHTATVLAGGEVLVVGGYGRLFGRIPLAVSLGRIFDAESSSWRPVRCPLNYGRLEHAALRLPDGKVLICGGIGQDKKALKSLELYDPATDCFELVGQMSWGRSKACLSLLPGGSVLISSGHRGEIFERDESSASGYRVRKLAQRFHFFHNGHSAISLADGTVLLICGGSSGIERFYPVEEELVKSSVRVPGNLDDQGAALLYDGRVFLAGGQRNLGGDSVRQTWFYDPQSDELVEGPLLSPSWRGVVQPGVSDLVMVDLFGGDALRRGRYILMCGGEYDPGRSQGPDVVLDSAWVYEAESGRLIDVGPMLTGHDDFAAAGLGVTDGASRVLIVGGHGGGDSFQVNCEIFSWPVK